MGSATAYIAFKTEHKDIVLNTLNLVDTGIDDPENSTPFMGLTLDNGIYVISKGLRRTDGFSDQDKRSLSQAVGFWYHDIDETTMVSTFESWNAGGEMSWRVYHEGYETIMHLETSGELPEFAQQVVSKFREQQTTDPDKDNVDFIFEIPVEIFRHFTSYHYGEIPNGTYTCLNSTTMESRGASKAGKKPWWKIF